jgi:hypothetical protein
MVKKIRVDIWGLNFLMPRDFPDHRDWDRLTGGTTLTGFSQRRSKLIHTAMENGSIARNAPDFGLSSRFPVIASNSPDSGTI